MSKDLNLLMNSQGIKMINIDFDKKTALITGSTRGIGKQIADDIVESGGEVIRTGTNNLDFTDDKKIQTFIKTLDTDYDKIDILVNNAGTNIIEDFSSYNVDDFDKLIQINLKGAFIISKYISNKMIKHRYGRIVNISSIFGGTSFLKRSIYSMTKAGIEGMTRGMALDLAKYDILVNAVSPGITLTDLTRNILGEDGIKEKKKNIPLGRLATTEDISNVVLFLCSDLNNYITGQNIIVDGGYVIW
jgi:3-oxoacyl-[acyl-carrier protein] reductase